MRNWRALQSDAQGLTTVEYVIILFLIAIAAIAVWQEFGESVEEKSREASTEIGSLGR